MNTLLKDSSLLSISLAFLMLYRMRYIDDSSNLNIIVQYFVELFMEYSHYSYEFNFYYNKVPAVSWIWINLFAMVLILNVQQCLDVLFSVPLSYWILCKLPSRLFFGFNRIRWDFIFGKNQQKELQNIHNYFFFNKYYKNQLTSACVVVWMGAPFVGKMAIIAITAKTNELIWIIFV